MALAWTDSPTATLTVRKYQSGTEKFTFQGVASSNSAGTPEQFLEAVNHILAFGGLSATITDIKRVVTEGAEEE